MAQREGGDGRRDEEDDLHAVGDVGRGGGAGARREHGAQHRGADRAAQAAEEVRRRHGDAEPAPVDAVLHGDGQHLADEAEAEPEHGEREADRRPRRILRDGGQREQRDGHEREAGDRVTPCSGPCARSRGRRGSSTA